MFLKKRVSTPDLAHTKTHRKQIFWNLGWFQAGPHQKDVQSTIIKTKIHPWTPELWSILGCQPYICVQPTFGAKPSMAQRQLFFEVPSLRKIYCSQLRYYTFHYLLPAVNRQPWFPRGRTRREGSACPPTGLYVCSLRVNNPYHARRFLAWYNWGCGTNEARFP